MIAPFIALSLALQAAPIPDALERQSLPARGCAAYLWSVSDRKLIAMASAEPAQLRVVLGGKPVDIARTALVGAGEFGLGGTADYRSGDVTARLAMTIVTRPDMTDGGGVPQGTLTIVRPGADEVIVPVAGLIGCAPAR